MSVNPIGPLSPQEWQDAIDAPFGKALAILRRHDPLWGLAPGEKVKWKARYTREVREDGVAYIMAASKEEAEKKAETLQAHEINWDVAGWDYDEAGELLDIEVAKMTLELIPHTKRRKMSKARATKIFLARNGICFTCRQQIRAGQAWFIEHPVPIAQGGSDKDEDLWPAHTACKAEKDATDAASKAKRDRLVTASWDNGGKPKMQSRGFPKAEKQRRATTALTPKFDGDIMALRADWSPAVLRTEEL